MGKIGLCVWGGVVRAPQRRGGRVLGKGLSDKPVPRGQSKTCDDDSPIAPRSGLEDFFPKKFPPYIPQNDQRIVSIILSHTCCGTLGPPPNLPCQLVGGHRQPVGGPRHKSPKGGGSRKGARTTPPPPPRKPISPSLGCFWKTCRRSSTRCTHNADTPPGGCLFRGLGITGMGGIWTET